MGGLRRRILKNSFLGHHTGFLIWLRSYIIVELYAYEVHDIIIDVKNESVQSYYD